MKNNNEAFAETAMLIRRPANEVYQAFINPAATTKFWFSKSSGRLDENKELTWTWEKFGVDVKVIVEELEENKRIKIKWGNYKNLTEVEWTFTEMSEGTFVNVVNSGFKGDTNEIIKQVRDSTGGFTWLLSGLKAYLEYGIELNLINDRYPEENSDNKKLKDNYGNKSLSN